MKKLLLLFAIILSSCTAISQVPTKVSMLKYIELEEIPDCPPSGYITFFYQDSLRAIDSTCTVYNLGAPVGNVFDTTGIAWKDSANHFSQTNFFNYNTTITTWDTLDGTGNTGIKKVFDLKVYWAPITFADSVVVDSIAIRASSTLGGLFTGQVLASISPDIEGDPGGSENFVWVGQGNNTAAIQRIVLTSTTDTIPAGDYWITALADTVDTGIGDGGKFEHVMNQGTYFDADSLPYYEVFYHTIGAAPFAINAKNINSTGYYLNGLPFSNYLLSLFQQLPPGTEGQFLYNNDGVWDTTGFIRYDDTNGRIGIGVAAPTQQLHIGKNFQFPQTTYNGGTPFGIIYKGSFPFIHDFNYGNNGVVTTTGENIFLGINAGNLTMGSTATNPLYGSQNTGVGFGTLNSNTLGYGNTGLGHGVLFANTEGGANSGFGRWTLNANTLGNENTAGGVFSLLKNVDGNNNTAFGFYSGAMYGDGVTGKDNTTGDYGIFIGSSTRPLADNDQNETVIGYNMQGHGSNTVTIGNSSITRNYFTGNIITPDTLDAWAIKLKGVLFDPDFTRYLTTDAYAGTNIVDWLADDTTAATRMATAHYVAANSGGGEVDTTGTPKINYLPKFTSSSAIGSSPFYISGTDSALISTRKGAYSLGGNLWMGTGGTKAIGTALNSGKGSYNSTFGIMAGDSITEGKYNALFGQATGHNIKTGDGNVGFGSSALQELISGSNNVAIGDGAGAFLNTSGDITTASGSIFIGKTTTSLADNQSNEIVFGYLAAGHGSNTATWGNTSIVNHYFSGKLQVPTVKITGGSPGTGKVLMSDSDGDATWESMTPVLTATVPLSSAEILDLFTTPRTIVNNPGSGYMIEVISATIGWTSGTPYDASTDDIVLGHVSGTRFNQVHFYVPWQATSTLYYRGIIDQSLSTLVPNTSLVAYTESANPTSGTGTCKIYITYRIITL